MSSEPKYYIFSENEDYSNALLNCEAENLRATIITSCFLALFGIDNRESRTNIRRTKMLQLTARHSIILDYLSKVWIIEWLIC